MSFDWITPHLAVGGHLTPDDLAALASGHRLAAVVDLRAEARDDEAALRRAGVAFLHLPTPDEHPSTLTDLDRGVAFARERIAAGERVLIHCQHGIGRSALLALCLLCEGGEAPLEALRRAKDARELVSPSAAQFEGWCAWLEARRIAPPDYESFARIAYRARAEAGACGAETTSAATLTGPGRLTVREAPMPKPGAGQVRIALEGCGVCASNLGPWAGPEWMHFPTEPGALGHEGWGVVDAVGDGVAGLNVGDRVAALSYHAYARHDLADAAAVVKLPRALDGEPFPGEPLGCAMNIFRRAEIEAGQTVAIVGIGFLGALLTRLATDAGARVIAVSRRPFSRDVAREMGAAEVIPMNDHWAILERVKALTDGRFCDRVIEAVGKQWPLDLAGELAAERGRLVIAGYHQDGPRQVNMQLWNWRGLDVVNAHERDPAIYVRGLREAVDAVASGRLDPRPLYTHTYPLERLDDALNATRDRPDGFLKALVSYA